MAFTPEDGTGVEDANAYASVSYVTGYLNDRMRHSENGWDALTDTKKQAHIIQATDYIERTNVGRWKGQRCSADQGLSWPRDNAKSADGFYYSSESIPTLLKQAVAEYAVRAAGSTLLPDPTEDDSGRAILEEQVGPIRTVYGSGGVRAIKKYPAADRLLRDLIRSPGGRTFR